MRRAGRVVGTAVVLVLVLAAAWVVTIPVRVWWDARGDDRTPSDAVVVLGAAQYDGTPSAIFRWRLSHARDLYEAGVAPVVITVGGGAEGDRTTEAAAGRDWLIAEGVPADAVVAVEQGTNTQDSLAAAAAQMSERGWTSAVLVTDPWHTFRSKALAAAAGIDAVSSPTRSGPAVQTRQTQVRYILRESAAYLLWRLTGETGHSGLDAA
jgi:uncharacterized SAM-binding protein YcdF (DUF218 family)